MNYKDFCSEKPFFLLRCFNIKTFMLRNKSYYFGGLHEFYESNFLAF